MWYFSFGCSHILCKYMIKVDIEDFNEAREYFMESFGTKWCGQYNEQEAQEMVEKYGYQIIDTKEVVK